ncbi:MAG: aspartate aminotransferase [Chromatiales bacterium 21-64-14]|nr:MAG: aspartate aminotransferase [Chromatiales bacterium 21-64-14]HQU17372.1 pyridoxal phosphate-dependent aminotransferase [Gammaproteobacteria bacterium]
MHITLSDRVQRIKPSPTLAVTARAAELRAAGRNIIGLGAGEPDFDTPDHIKEAAIRAIHDGYTKYTPVDGAPSLKKAIAAKFERENGLQFEPRQILVSCGGKQSFYNLAQALLNAGDEVIIPAPYWVSYPDIVLLADAVPVIVAASMDHGFRITPEQLEAAITPRTRLLVLNSPSNPTGIAYSHAELAALASVLLRHPQVMVATDDMYEHILWTDEPFANLVNVCPDLMPRSIVLNGVSKAYAMTGWRIGYAGGPAELIGAMKNIQSQSTSNPSSISQVAAQAALEGDQSCILSMRKAFKQRHDFIVEALNALPGVDCLPCQGTFYCFPNLEEVIEAQGLANDVALAEFLLAKAEVAVVPGSAFGAPGHLRLSYATSMENLKEAVTRIRAALPQALPGLD